MSDNHGNTPAAWSAVAVALLGFVVGSVGMMLEPISWPVFWAGVVITAASAVVFLVMSKMGLHGSDH